VPFAGKGGSESASKTGLIRGITQQRSMQRAVLQCRDQGSRKVEAFFAAMPKPDRNEILRLIASHSEFCRQEITHRVRKIDQ